MNINADEIVQEAARRRLINFARYMQPDMVVKPFHAVYYRLLDMFAHGLIKKMIVQIPPQHGKSEGSSRKLPAYLLGINPDVRIAIGSYSATIAEDFNRDVQKVIDNEKYAKVFPNTALNGSNVVTMAHLAKRNSSVFEIVGHKGSLRAVGRGGSLTGRTIDIMIMDDVYKDYAEANSPVIREGAWKWYTSVVKTRLHNKSQQLIVFTRWHKDDLIGKIEQSDEKIVDVTCWDDLKQVGRDTWVRINFEALKTSEPTELDDRQKGEALWEEMHSRQDLEALRKMDAVQFECLHQGHPASAEGRLYSHDFKTWVDKAEWGTFVRSGNYTDVADEGDDYLCSICYDVYRGDNTFYNEHTKRFEPILYVLVTDIEFTKEDTEITSVTIPAMINRNGTQKAWIESNNGGSGFAKIVMKKVKAIVEPFYQGGNKESRVITNAAMVNAQIIMPLGWDTRFPTAYKHITEFLRNFKANTHDDIEDALTGIYEKEIASGNIQPYNRVNRGVTRIN